MVVLSKLKGYCVVIVNLRGEDFGPHFPVLGHAASVVRGLHLAGRKQFAPDVHGAARHGARAG